ncbi:transposase [Anaerorhabdus sp.]|uniref:transposase n=1 Tax=Anaerorhabdus sp. TaxID=1872524 RepID=UPI003FA526A5
MTKNIMIHNSHNVLNLVFHFICPTKYRRLDIDEIIYVYLKQICVGIETHYESIKFLEIGADKEHDHFLI